MSEWISVKDDLPEFNKRLLIYNNLGIIIGILDKNINEFYEFSTTLCVHNVTHWMPLPDAPKEKE